MLTEEGRVEDEAGGGEGAKNDFNWLLQLSRYIFGHLPELQRILHRNDTGIT